MVGLERRIGKKEEVLRKGERKRTHKRYFSQSTKLPSQKLPSHGPADSFTYMSTVFPFPDKEKPNHETKWLASSWWQLQHTTNTHMEWLTKCKTSMLTRRASAPSIVTNSTFPATSAAVLLFTISCLFEYCRYTVFPRTWAGSDDEA